MLSIMPFKILFKEIIQIFEAVYHEKYWEKFLVRSYLLMSFRILTVLKWPKLMTILTTKFHLRNSHKQTYPQDGFAKNRISLQTLRSLIRSRKYFYLGINCQNWFNIVGFLKSGRNRNSVLWHILVADNWCSLSTENLRNNCHLLASLNLVETFWDQNMNIDMILVLGCKVSSDDKLIVKVTIHLLQAVSLLEVEEQVILY